MQEQARPTTLRVRAIANGVALAAGAALLALASAPAPVSAAEGPAVRRTTLIVHDLDASLRFYRDVLGFEVWLENTGTVGPQSLPSDAPVGSPSRFAVMKGKHPWLGMVGLLQYGPARPIPAAPERLVPGDAVLMIETDDLDGIHARMQRAGTPILRAPRSSVVTGAGGAQWTATFLFAFDPDGHLLEINERAGAPVDAADDARAEVRFRRDYATARHGQLHVLRAAPAGAAPSRPPLVLLHMSPLSGRMFEAFMAQAARDRVVYAPDLPGYGASDAPAERPPLAEYAGAIGDWLDTLGEPVDLLGYHTGAAVAVELARTRGAGVRRVVLASVPIFDAATQARIRTATPAEPREDGSHVLEMWRSSFAARMPGQGLEAIGRTVADKQLAHHSEWAVRSLVDHPLEAGLAAVTQPTLVLRLGDGLGAGSARAAALVSGARLIERTQWSYGLFDAVPADLAALVREFLDAPAAARGTAPAGVAPGR